MSVCRTCLSTKSRMHDLRRHQLRQIFEKITDIHFSVDDDTFAICYICYWQLQRSHRFISMSQTANKILSNAITNDSGVFTASLGELTITNNFIVTPVACLSLGEQTLESAVKLEPIEIKEELESPDAGMKVDLQHLKVAFHAAQLEDVHNPELCTAGAPAAAATRPVKPNTNREYKCTRQQECIQSAPAAAPAAAAAAAAQPARRHPAHVVHNPNITQRKHLNEHAPRPTPEPDAGAGADVGAGAGAGAGKRFPCDYCNKVFDQRCRQRSHLRVHTGERPYSCRACDAAFSEQSTLNKHVASHDKRKRYVCDACRRGFTYKPALAAHMRTHTGERPHRCAVCGARFAQVGTLHSHLSSHRGARAFPCRACGDTFAERGALARHVRAVHEGARGGHACRECGRVFAAAETLARHALTHAASARSYACDACAKTYTARSSFTKHIKRCRALNKL